jgi:MFS family permease
VGGFAAFWSARTVSMLGSGFSTFAVPVYLYDLGASPVTIGLVLAAKAGPILLAPLAGVLADRVDPRRVMIACDAGQLLATGAVAVLLPPPAVLVGLVVVSSLLGTAFLPAGKSAVPKLVPRDRLGRANALLGVSANVAVAGGPLLGALVYQFAGARAAFAVDAATYGVSALLLLLVPRMRPVGRAAPRVLADLRDGLVHVAGDRTVRAVAIGLLLGVGFAAMDNTALVFLTRDELGGSAAAPGIALSVFGVGMVAVPLLLLRRTVAGLTLMAGGLAVSGLGLVLAGLAPALVLAVLAYGLAGAGNGLENIGVDTAVGEHVPAELLGRVFGAVYAPIALADVLASAVAGLLVEATSARAVFVIAGVGSAVAAGVVVLLSRPRAGGR